MQNVSARALLADLTSSLQGLAANTGIDVPVIVSIAGVIVAVIGVAVALIGIGVGAAVNIYCHRRHPPIRPLTSEQIWQIVAEYRTLFTSAERAKGVGPVPVAGSGATSVDYGTARSTTMRNISPELKAMLLPELSGGTIADIARYFEEIHASEAPAADLIAYLEPKYRVKKVQILRKAIAVGLLQHDGEFRPETRLRYVGRAPAAPRAGGADDSASATSVATTEN